jgi:ketosteroid isomerase-like protein
MSEENVEIVRRALDATSGGDPNAPQAVFDPLIEWDMSGVAGWLEEPVYRGEEVGDFLRAWADSWHHWHFSFGEVREAGEDRVFAAIHEVGRGTESDVAVEQDRYLVFTVRARRILRV